MPAVTGYGTVTRYVTKRFTLPLEVITSKNDTHMHSYFYRGSNSMHMRPPHRGGPHGAVRALRRVAARSLRAAR